MSSTGAPRRRGADPTGPRAGSSATRPGDLGAAEVLGWVGADIDDLLAIAPDTIGIQDVADVLRGIDAQVNRLQAYSLAVTASFDRRDGAKQVEARSTQDFLQRQLRRSPGQANDTLNTARALEEGHDATREAMNQGRISPDHAREIV